MSPENAKVFIAEDVKYWRKVLKRELKKEGHDVLLVASTLPEAINKLRKFKEKGIQVAVIDGNMDPDNSGGGQDGEVLVGIIRALEPKVKIIGMSSHKIKGVDINVLKGNERLLGKIVKNI